MSNNVRVMIPCPLCRNEFSSSEIEVHVDQCCNERASKKTKTNASNRNSNNERSSLFSPCPICNRQIASKNLQYHVNLCCEFPGEVKTHVESLSAKSIHQVSGTENISGPSTPIVLDLSSDEGVEFVVDRIADIAHSEKNVHNNSAIQTKKVLRDSQLASSAGSQRTPRQGNAFANMMQSAVRAAKRYYVSLSKSGACTWHENLERSKEAFTVSKTVPIEVKQVGVVVVVVEAGAGTYDVNTSIKSILGSKQTSPGFEIWGQSRLTPSVLKSCIQKCVRRGWGELALQAAIELMVKDFRQLLRRVPVIVTEDSMLHPSYDLLIVLLLLDHKESFRPNFEILQKYLLVIYEVSLQVKLQDPFFLKLPFSALSSSIHLQIPNTSQDSYKAEGLSVSLLVRAAYGGMKGDVGALQALALVWASRFGYSSVSSSDWFVFLDKAHDIKVESTSNRVTTIQSLLSRGPRFKTNVNQLAVGVDFHCCPWITSRALELAEKHKTVEFIRLKNEIRESQETVDMESLCNSAMWKYRSGLNVRNQQLFGIRKEAPIHGLNPRETNCEAIDQICSTEYSVMSVLAQLPLDQHNEATDAQAASSSKSFLEMLWKLVEGYVEDVARSFLVRNTIT